MFTSIIHFLKKSEKAQEVLAYIFSLAICAGFLTWMFIKATN